MFKKYFLALSIYLFAQLSHSALLPLTSAWVNIGGLTGQLLPVKYIYIHGWWTGHDCRTPNVLCNTWPTISSDLRDTVQVGWNTGLDWRYEGVDRLEASLNANCKIGVNRCVIICHSTGCPITAKLLDTKGSPLPWTIEKVLALASAEGGSEMSELAAATVPYVDLVLPGVRHITPGIVRNAYDHNDTAGVPFIHLAGYDSSSFGSWSGAVSAATIPGEDDGTVGFHSACAYSQVFSSTWCSNDYTWVWRKTWYGMKYVTRGVAQWTNHSRSEYCGRDGCDKTHMQLTDPQFQSQAKVAEPEYTPPIF